MQTTSMQPRGQLDLSTANALYSKTNYVELSVRALREFVEAQPRAPHSVCVGRRLFYKPLWNSLVGQLYYSHLGMLGVIDLTTGDYKPVATQSRLMRRAGFTLERFLCED